MANKYARGWKPRDTVSAIDAIVYLTVSMPKQTEPTREKKAA